MLKRTAEGKIIQWGNKLKSFNQISAINDDFNDQSMMTSFSGFKPLNKNNILKWGLKQKKQKGG